MDFKDQTVIVTGAAGNLGAAIAERVAAGHANLVLADTNSERLAALAEALGDVETLVVGGADVRTEAGCARIVAEALRRFGRVDALLNTVGTFKTAEVAENAAEDWAFLMDLNALSALRLSKAVLAPMRAQRYGRIVHTAAGAGQKSFASSAVYSASKAAVIRIAEAISEENKAHGITANCVLPGIIDTPQNRAAMPDADSSTWVAPAALAEAFAFLGSRAAGAITGAALPVLGRG